jgi:hypothetical protein
MKNRNNRLFFALLFAAALMHAGALVLIPDISRRPEEKPVEISPTEITLSFPPEKPEPPPAPPPPAPRPPEPERPQSPAPLPEPVPEPLPAPAVVEPAPEPPAVVPSLAEPVAAEPGPDPAETEIAGKRGGEGTPDTTVTEPLAPSTGVASGRPVFDPKVQEDLLLRDRKSVV